MKCTLYADFFCGSTALMHTFCRLFAHFLQQMIQVLQTSCTLILYLQTFCRTYAHFLQRTRFLFADFMHTYSRPDADLMQNKSMHCRMLTDSVHTLCRANQCHSNAAAGPRGPAGGGGTLCDAPQLRPGRRSGGPGRRSGGPGRRSGGPGRRSGGPGRRSCGPGRRSPVAPCAYFVLPGDAAAAAAAPCLPGEGTAREGEAEAREDEVVAQAGEAEGAASRV